MLVKVSALKKAITLTFLSLKPKAQTSPKPILLEYISLGTIVTNFRQAAIAGEFLITAEVAPPKGGNVAHMVEMASCLKGRVHAVNITDGSRAVMRMSPLVSSVILMQHGIEPVCQFACRDRNRIGLQGDLLGAHALGIHNILALTGDPIKAGDYPKAKAVFDLEAVRLLQIISHLNHGLDGNEKPLPDGAVDLFAGAAVDPQSKSWSGLQSRFDRKVNAGAQFFQSQLISYSEARCGGDYLQKNLLSQEGIEFKEEHRIDLKKYRWQPPLDLMDE